MRARGPGRAWVAGRLWWLGGGLASLVFLGAATRDVSRWKGDWLWGYHHVSEALPVVLVLVAAAAAWDAGSADNGVRAWNGRVPDRRWKVPLSSIAKLVAATVAAYLAATAGVVAVTLLSRGEVPLEATLEVTHHLAVLGFAAALGLALGSVLPSLYATIAALSVLAVLLLARPLGEASRPFEVAGTAGGVAGSIPMVGREITLIIALALSTIVLGAFACIGGGRRDGAVVAAALSIVPLLIGGAVVPTGLYTQSRLPPDRCAQSTIKVCVFPGYDGLLVPVHDNLVNFMALARKRGMATRLLPQVYRQDNGAALPDGVGTIMVWGSERTTGDPGARTTALAVSTPLWCPAMFGDVAPTRLLQHRQLVFDWALAVLGDPSAEDFEKRHDLDLNARATVAKVNAALASLRACE